MKHAIIAMTALAVLALGVAGCGTESGTNPVPVTSMGLSIGFDLSMPQTVTPPDNGIQLGSNPEGIPDSVTVSSGLIMVRSVRLVTDPVTAVDTVITAADEDRDRLDASVRFKGPYVIKVSDDATSLGAVDIPVGNYRQLTFVLQKARATDDLGDYSDLAGSSVQLKGKVWRNGVGQSFVFETDYTSEFAVNGDFNVSEGAQGSLSLVFAAGSWFHAGSRWLDPNNPGDRLAIYQSMRHNISGGVAN